MFTRWVERVFDERDKYLRLTLLALSGIGYLIRVQTDPDDPLTPIDWVFAVLAHSHCARSARSGRWPARSASHSSSGGRGDVRPRRPGLTRSGASWALLELAMRVPGRRALLGAGVLTAVYLVGGVSDRHPRRARPTGCTAWPISVGVPVLLGVEHPGRAASWPGRPTTRGARRRVGEPRRPRRRAHRHRPRAARRGRPPRRVDGAAGRGRPARAAATPTRGSPRCSTTCTAPAPPPWRTCASWSRCCATPARSRRVGLPRSSPVRCPARWPAAVDRATQAGLTVEATIDPAVGDAGRGPRPGGAAADPGGPDQRGQARRPGRAARLVGDDGRTARSTGRSATTGRAARRRHRPRRSPARPTGSGAGGHGPDRHAGAGRGARRHAGPAGPARLAAATGLPARVLP